MGICGNKDTIDKIIDFLKKCADQFCTWVNDPDNEGFYEREQGGLVETIPHLMGRIKDRYLKVLLRGDYAAGLDLGLNDVVRDPSTGDLWIATGAFTTSGDMEADITSGNLSIFNGSIAEGVLYTPTFVGGVTRTVGARLEDYVSVKDFGAIGDGVTDDTAAFTAAIMAAKYAYAPEGQYLVDPSIDINMILGDKVILVYTTGIKVAVRSVGNTKQLATVYIQELYTTSDVTPQSIGIFEDKIYISQDIASAGWGSSTVVQYSEFDLCFSNTSEIDYDIKKGITQNTSAQLTGVGHGSGCSVVNINGTKYLYTTLAQPVGSTDEWTAGTGYSRVPWNGGNPDQSAMQYYRNLMFVHRAEMCVSSDGKYIVFICFDRRDVKGSAVDTESISSELIIFDRTEVEAAANPSSVYPITRVQIAGPKFNYHNAQFQGVCCDGRFVYMLLGYVFPAGEHQIYTYSISGEFVKRTPCSFMAAINPDVFLKGTGLHVVSEIEPEGLAIYEDMIVTCVKYNFAVASTIVSFEGHNYFPWVTSTGITPWRHSYWKRTQAPATEEWDKTKTYTKDTNPIVYHKYVVGIGVKDLHPQEFPVQIQLYDVSNANVHAEGWARTMSVGQNQDFTVSQFDNQAQCFFPMIEYTTPGTMRLYDVNSFRQYGSDAIEQNSNGYCGRMNAFYEYGFKLGAADTDEHGASIEMRHDKNDTSPGGIILRTPSRGAVMYISVPGEDGKDETWIYTSGLVPAADNVSYLGTPVYRWTNVYTADSAITTSDVDYKQDISEIPEELLNAWGNVQPKQFKMKDAIKLKGEVNARIHSGYIAQEIQKAFENANINPAQYGFFCHDSWQNRTEFRDVLGENGEFKLTKQETASGDCYSLRMAEALVLECAYLRKCLQDISRRINLLEEDS
jgi:hypothetical protein